MLEVRDATLSDAEPILKIYDYYVKNTAITFEYDTPGLEEFQQRMDDIMQKYPYLVALKDGAIKGYAYARPFVGRAAYDWSCETTIYLDPDSQKCGMGKALYEALQKALHDMGILNLYACIGYPERNDEYLTTNSADFHEHMGFKKVGEFHQCGYKFGRWYHMIWMEKQIADHLENQPPVRCYRETKYQIRPITELDDAQIAKIIRNNLEAYHLDIPGTAYFDPELEHLSKYYAEQPKKRAYLILTQGNQVLGGVGIAEFPGFADCAEIQKLYLSDRVKGNGLGKRLMQEAEETARAMQYHCLYLETHSALKAAIGLYEKLGFQKIEKPATVLHSTMDRFYLKSL